MTKKSKIVIGSAVVAVLLLLVVVLLGKLGLMPVPGVHSVFQTPGTCSTCHETWYDEASFAFNPKGNKKKPGGVTIGCAECHPVQYEEYMLSAMGSSKNPLRPGCVNCHDNPHSVSQWFNFMYLAPQSWKNVQLALRDREYYDNVLTPKLSIKERTRFIKTGSRRCIECHTDPSHQQYFKNSVGLYRADVPAHQKKQTDGLTCVQCHKNLTHNLSVPSTWGAKKTKAEQGNVKAGQSKSESCAGCHGENGNSPAGMFPSIAGLDPNYLYLQLNAFKSGQRKSDIMQGIVAALSDQDMADLAEYYTTQKIQPTHPLPKVLSLLQRATMEQGQQRYRDNCARCHGLTGKGQGIFPALAGQHPEYILAQIEDFKSGNRASHSVMRDVIKGLTAKDLQKIADYLASQK
ncbi:MAG TPA: c-type cytochrome [Gammaproteobacteria bacterium]|nr:c-type cytochrome [Gammaproteobacteria bacterium]